MIRLIALILMLCAPPALAAPQQVTLPDGRRYLIDLPPAPAGAAMILALHGGGGNPAQFARSTGFGAPATAAGFAVIWPAGTGRGRALTWNGGSCCGGAQRRGVDDLAFLDRVIADAAARFGLDGGAVFLTGMSNGSILAERYAALRPGRVAAVAGVAGTLDVAGTRVAGPVRVLHIHGTADRHVPYAGGIGPDSLGATDFAPVPAVMAAFRAAAGGPLRQVQRIIDPAPDGMQVVQFDDLDAQGRPFLRLLRIEGGGHAWPGSRRAARQGGTRDIRANDEILRFFAEVP